MARLSMVVKNRIVAGGLLGAIGLTYGYTMYRMKDSTEALMEEFGSSAPARDAGK